MATRLLRAASGRALASPGAAHAALWAADDSLRRLLALLAAAARCPLRGPAAALADRVLALPPAANAGHLAQAEVAANALGCERRVLLLSLPALWDLLLEGLLDGGGGGGGDGDGGAGVAAAVGAFLDTLALLAPPLEAVLGALAAHHHRRGEEGKAAAAAKTSRGTAEQEEAEFQTLLRLWSGLRAAAIILEEAFAPAAAAPFAPPPPPGEGRGAAVATAVAGLRECDPRALGALRAVAAAATAAAAAAAAGSGPAAAAAAAAAAVQRYLEEVALSDRTAALFGAAAAAAGPEPALVAGLEGLLAGEGGGPLLGPDFPAGRAARRAVLNYFVRAGRGDAVARVCRRSVEAALSYVNLLESAPALAAAAAAGAGGRNPKRLFAMEAYSDAMETGEDLVEILAQTASLRREMVAYLRQLVQNCGSAEVFYSAKIAPPSWSATDKFKDFAPGVIFALQFIYRNAGFNTLFDTISLPTGACPWNTDHNKHHVTAISGSVTDPFAKIFGLRSLEDQQLYTDVCSIFQSALFNFDPTKFSRDLQRVQTRSGGVKMPQMLICAGFSQLVLTRIPRSETAPLINALSLTQPAQSPVVLTPEEADVLRWVMLGCPGMSKSTSSTLMQLQATVFLASHAVSNPVSFWYALIFDPESQTQSFIPSIEVDDDEGIRLAMGYVGWYRCPNGHLYTVGNCTYPMEIARCAQCGARIGGENHNAVAGVTRLNQGPAVNRVKGFSRAAGSVETFGGTLHSATRAYTKFFIHAMLTMSFYLTESQSRKESVIKLINQRSGQDNETSRANAKAYLDHSVSDHWRALQQVGSGGRGDLPEDIGALALLLMIRRIHLKPSLNASNVFNSAAKSDVFIEALQQTAIHKYWTGLSNKNNWHPDIAAVMQALSDLGKVDAVKAYLGAERWHAVVAEGLGVDSAGKVAAALRPWGAAATALWGQADVPSFRHFKAHFGDHSDGNKADRYPLLAAFLENERHLSLIKHIADILDWHQILFEVLSERRPTRDEAQRITNQDVIGLLPQNRQADALQTLNRFCEGFNNSFGFVQNLYECQRNPFLTPEGEVDLSGTGRGGADGKMSPATPVAFSVPNVAPGEADAAGLCTVQLLVFLQRCHNGLFDGLARLQRAAAIVAAEADLEDDGMGEEKGDEAADPSREAVDEEDEAAARARLPATSLATPAAVRRQRLIDYARARDLAPLVIQHADQVLEPGAPGAGSITGYNYTAIQAALGRKIFQTATRIVLQIPNFQFAGELRAAGTLRDLQARIPQEQVPATQCENILAELDTQERLDALRRRLEDCARFLAGVGGRTAAAAAAAAGALGGGGGGGASGATLLDDYVLGTLLVPRKEWEAARPAPMRQLRLAHLQSLLLALEEASAGGGLLDSVCYKYREPLPPELAEALRTNARGAVRTQGSLDLSQVVPALRDLLVEQLGQDTWPAEDQLKAYLTFVAPDLEDQPWYRELFPDDLQIAHAYQTFKLLRDIQK